METSIRNNFINLLYQQNLIPKLYQLINNETCNEIKSCACILFQEIIRCHRVKPNSMNYNENLNYVENYQLIEQAQSDENLEILLKNIFSSSFIKDDKTIYFGTIMLIVLFDTTRISDLYGEEFNDMGYIRNNICLHITTDFNLISNYIKNYKDYLQENVDKLIENKKTKFGNTNLAIVNFISILTIFQIDIIDKKIIENDIFGLLWKYVPYFPDNNAFHTFIFKTTEFILLSEIYQSPISSLELNTHCIDTVLYLLKSHHCSIFENSNLFFFGNSVLLFNYLIDNVQILVVLLNLIEQSNTLKCSYYGFLLTLLGKISKLPLTTFLPDNEIIIELLKYPENIKSKKEYILDRLQYWYTNVINKFIKTSQIDPNVTNVTNLLCDDYGDNYFNKFDENFSQNNIDINGNYVTDETKIEQIHLIIKSEVDQGLEFMNSIKKSLNFGNNMSRITNNNSSYGKDPFLYSSDDENSSDEYESDENINDQSNKTDINQVKYVKDQKVDDSLIFYPPENEYKNINEFEIIKTNPEERLLNPYINNFEFGGKNNKYISSLLNDCISTRLKDFSNSNSNSKSNSIENKINDEIISNQNEQMTNNLAKQVQQINFEQENTTNDQLNIKIKYDNSCTSASEYHSFPSIEENIGSIAGDEISNFKSTTDEYLFSKLEENKNFKFERKATSSPCNLSFENDVEIEITQTFELKDDTFEDD